MAPRLLVLDSVLVDVTVRVDALPARGSDTRALESLVAAGGGFNVAAAAARQGMAVVYGGRLGRGPLSGVARAALAGEGAALALAADPAGDVGFCLVVVERDGERTFVTAPGCELHLSRADLASLAPRRGDVLYLSGYNLLYPEVGRTVADWLSRVPAGVVVALDPGARVADVPRNLREAALTRADWVLTSVGEARALTGADGAAALAGALARHAGRGAVVHDGERGCAVAVGDSVTTVPAFRVTPVDTNGAGDAHNGVFLAGLSAGLAPEAAAERANAAAAIAVTRLGPATAPRARELDEWLARGPVRA